jgi:hypothetical protein
LAAYPPFPEFLGLKLKFDPQERFQSEWCRYYKEFLKDEILHSGRVAIKAIKGTASFIGKDAKN